MVVDVAEPTHVSAARRSAIDAAKALGFDELRCGRVALVATEMASNLIKHAPGGRIFVTRYSDVSGKGVEVMSLDKGEGIADLPRALEDGFSTRGTPGGGLGTIRRQADDFWVFSRPGQGTAIMARIGAPADGEPTVSATVGSVLAPYPGETLCGDAWAVSQGPDGPTLLVVDGSGHGPLAEIAARAAVEAFRASTAQSCVGLIEDIHRALEPTRGAAVAIARIDRSHRLVRYVGIGNISGALLTDGRMRRMVSHNGIAGQIVHRIREFEYPFTSVPTVIMHSDGLSSRWDLGTYPGLAMSHPSVISGVLFRDFARGRDDASIVTLRG
ncbi:MAG TPA: ATP-binding SpoIIE family protein phosphatase [Alphaproteobacteria bacterium]|jgi:anti-sigma regulatory factor (Ser/Thr protein kinase)|nr:ATP-binding SpoIIE family protein phosphatase [Alphaproteobacteria bacterium]